MFNELPANRQVPASYRLAGTSAPAGASIYIGSLPVSRLEPTGKQQ